MCGRYSDSQNPKPEWNSHFTQPQSDLSFVPRYNIAPTQAASVVVLESGKLVEKKMTWGFLPAWSTTPIINAKQETLTSKPTFKSAFESHRCLVPADGFYEWKKIMGRKCRFVLFCLTTNPFILREYGRVARKTISDLKRF
jgi:putative SOS response-associated peptidase YedK